MEIKYIDNSYNYDGQRHVLNRLAKIGDTKVRFIVQRDTSARGSYATAAILNAHMEWTPLLEAPTNEWYTAADNAKPSDLVKDKLHAVVGQMADRVVGFLEA